MTTTTKRLTAFQVIVVDDGQTDLIWIDANDVIGFHQCGEHEFTFVAMRDGRELSVRHYEKDFRERYEKAIGEDADLATMRQQRDELLAACKVAVEQCDPWDCVEIIRAAIAKCEG